MAVTRKNSESLGARLPPATTPEGREDQLIASAVDLAEQQLRDGTASAQVITHFLRLGSTRERLEQEKIRKENILLESRASAIEQAARVEELMSEAMRVFRGYQGNPDSEAFYDE